MDIHLEVYSFRVQGHIISPLLLFCYLRKLRPHLLSFGLDVAWYFSQKEIRKFTKHQNVAPVRRARMRVEGAELPADCD